MNKTEFKCIYCGSYIINDKYEKMLIDRFRLLSNQGKEYILQTTDMAVAKYKKKILYLPQIK